MICARKGTMASSAALATAPRALKGGIMGIMRDCEGSFVFVATSTRRKKNEMSHILVNCDLQLRQSGKH